MATIAISAAVAAGFTALSKVSEGIAAKNAGNYNAEVARQNAIHAVQAGRARVENVGLKNAAVGGHIKAVQAANNVDVNSGSAVDVQKSARMAGNVDVVNTMNDALIEAYGYNAKSTLDKYGAKTAEIGGYLGAAGAIAGAAGDIFGGGGATGVGNASSTSSSLGSALVATNNYAGPDTSTFSNTG
jgi:hypothetical protein